MMIDTAFDLSEFTDDEQLQILNRVNEEKAEILKQRELAKWRHTAHLNNVALLRIAADYLDWLYINGRGSTFSTFVDEFGYDSKLASAVFNQVVKLYDQMNTMVFPSDALLGDVDYAKPSYAMETDDD
ncbi:hypothetical protein [Methylomonas sp. 11b]|uniref:hypothetical protein n=1 Tax=Methylomonas sp. 11b TaxID=1168169 RepID=UPI0012DE78B4|nr:hypothetical protein [Methylomonas sp. 11b]